MKNYILFLFVILTTATANNALARLENMDQDATLTVIKGETHYDLTVDGQKACSIAISAVKYQERNKTLTEGQKRHTCNANYDVLAYSYTHWLSANTWADFTLVHTGLSEPVAHAEYKIAEASSLRFQSPKYNDWQN